MQALTVLNKYDYNITLIGTVKYRIIHNKIQFLSVTAYT